MTGKIQHEMADSGPALSVSLAESGVSSTRGRHLPTSASDLICQGNTQNLHSKGKSKAFAYYTLLRSYV